MNMNTIARSLLALSLALTAQGVGHAQSAAAPTAAGPYRVVKTYHVGGDAKYWDYMSFDQEHGLLYVSLGNHMAVIDAATGKTVGDIGGMKRCHGVALVPTVNRGFISDGDDEAVVIFDLKTYKTLGKVNVGPDGDGIHYDPATKKVWVVSGDGNSVIAIPENIDPKAGKAEEPLPLGGKPEFFVIDKGKAYINLTDKNEVVVVDTATKKILNRWPVAPGGANTAMAMDRVNRRLFLGCRNPQKLIVMDATNGKVLSDIPIGAGCDATLFDDGYAFACTRDGKLTVARESSPGKFELVQTVPTATWAGTMAVDPKTHTIYLPTSDFEGPVTSFARLDKSKVVKPETFKIIVVGRAGK
jgi:DNA-binding beta-propeller fold protein YncE